MKLENQVVSLEIAKKLKELGVNQESLCTWVQSTVGKMEYKIISFNEFYGAHHDYFCAGFNDEVHPMFAAFTVAELRDMMKENEYAVTVTYIEDCYHVDSENGYETCKTEADAEGKRLIYLIENKLITI